MNTVTTISQKLYSEYSKHRTRRTAIVDAFILFNIFTALVQFVYVILVGNFPFNSFLSGLLCHVGLFALAVSLRLQLSVSGEFGNVTQEKAFGDFIFGGVVLFFVVFSFMG